MRQRPQRRPQRRPRRPQRDRWLTTAMVLFAAGLLALAVMFGLFASGHRRWPTWLSLSSLLLPIGLAVGIARTRRQAHRTAPRGGRDVPADGGRDLPADGGRNSPVDGGRKHVAGNGRTEIAHTADEVPADSGSRDPADSADRADG